MIKSGEFCTFTAQIYEILALFSYFFHHAIPRQEKLRAAKGAVAASASDWDQDLNDAECGPVWGVPILMIIHHSLGDHMLFITRYQKNMAHIIEIESIILKSMGLKPVIPVSEVNAWVNKPLNNSTIEDFTSNIVGLNFQEWRWNPGKKEDLRTRWVK